MRERTAGKEVKCAHLLSQFRQLSIQGFDQDGLGFQLSLQVRG